MKPSRVRFTVRWMMAATALTGLAFGFISSGESDKFLYFLGSLSVVPSVAALLLDYLVGKAVEPRQRNVPSVAMKRLHQGILIVSTVLGSWLGMQALHESGHVIAARLTGGRVARVVLHPLAISRTDLARNPRPLAVAWSGPAAGALLPVLLWSVATGLRVPGSFVLRFFAGFCLIANGAYVGAGSFGKVGDAEEMIRYGSPGWLLWSFGAVTIPVGLWLWHGQGRHFGLGEGAGEVSPCVSYATLIATTLLVSSGLLVDGG